MLNLTWHINWALLRGQITLWWSQEAWWNNNDCTLQMYSSICHLISFYIHSSRADCKDFLISKLWSSLSFQLSTLCSLHAFHTECLLFLEMPGILNTQIGAGLKNQICSHIYLISSLKPNIISQYKQWSLDWNRHICIGFYDRKSKQGPFKISHHMHSLM